MMIASIIMFWGFYEATLLMPEDRFLYCILWPLGDWIWDEKWVLFCMLKSV